MPAVACFYMQTPQGVPGGCEIYRGNMPLYFLSQHGWQAQWFYLDRLVAETILTGSSFFEQFVQKFDLFVYPRLYVKNEAGLHIFKQLFSQLKSHGKKVIYEVDDDYTNEHRQVIDGDAMGIAREADAITVSTPYLGELMQSRTGLTTYTLPNMLDPNLWKGTHVQRTIPDDHVVIGLTGSKTHREDWRVLATVLPRILDEFPYVHLIVMGFHPDYLHNLPRTEYLEPLPYTQYAQVIKACDIILAPVDPVDLFNASKSPIKALEGMGAERLVRGTKAGAAVIATDNAVYRLAVQHGVNGLLVQQTPESWYENLSALIVDTPTRQRLQKKGYQWVWLHHNMAQGWRKWATTYQQILAS